MKIKQVYNSGDGGEEGENEMDFGRGIKQQYGAATETLFRDPIQKTIVPTVMAGGGGVGGGKRKGKKRT